MINEINVSITGLSHDLASSQFPDHINARGKSAARGRGVRWSFTKISYDQAEEIAMILRDVAKNINYISSGKNRAMEAFILRKDAEKITNQINSARKMNSGDELSRLCVTLGVALKKSADWMSGDDDEDPDALWDNYVMPAIHDYDSAVARGVVGEK